MNGKTLIVGSYLSPYVRKVLAVMAYKGIAYEIDPIVPFFGNEEFTSLSPARRIPVLVDDEITVADSTVIVEYLEERYPEPSILPEGPVQRALGRWYEEYADTVMGEVFIWRYWNQVILSRAVWGSQPDQAIVAEAVDRDLPAIFDYLESFLPGAGTLFGGVSIGDIAIASFFRNLSLARFEVDPARWPLTSAYVKRMLELPMFRSLLPFESLSMRNPIPQHRGRLIEAGAPVSERSFGGATPRRAVLSR